MVCTASKLIEIAKAEVGYLEKKSNSQLDDKTANAGSNNYTKYARDMAKAGAYNGNKNGFAWCDVFVDWLFYQLCDKDLKKAEDMICQTGDYGAGCLFSSRYYKNKGRLFQEPMPGDQIFFYNSTKSDIAHTGVVVKVDKTYVYTIEGNTSTASGVVANGGGVCEKKYKLTNSRIYGYGRPYYDDADEAIVKDVTKPVTKMTKKQFIKDVQKAIGAGVDGVAGPETLSKTITVSSVKNNKHAVVKVLQTYLYGLGYTEVGTADGVAGSKFTAAVKHYQRDNGLTADGEITAKQKTWQKLLGYSEDSAAELKQFVKDVQKAIGASVDGKAGSETLSKTPTVSWKINSTHPVVKVIQKRLYDLGYVEVGTADGVAGSKFASAVMHYQQDNGCTADGEITAKQKTWKKLLGMM